SIADAALRLRCQAAILDAEVVADDTADRPDFVALHRRTRSAPLRLWVFDLLHLDGRDLRTLPLIERQRLLRKVLRKAPDELRQSETFPDPLKLLKVVVEHGLEGIVSKRIDRPYRSGASRDWVKVKTAAWRAENLKRWRLFGTAR